MTVEELIKLLQKQDKDLPVMLSDLDYVPVHRVYKEDNRVVIE